MDRRHFISSAGTAIAANCVAQLSRALDNSFSTERASLPAQPAPVIFWISSPVGPDETAAVMGEDLGEHAIIEMARVDSAQNHELSWHSLQTLQASPQCIKALVPSTWKPGIYACRVRRGVAVSNTLLANSPTAWWWNGDGGSFATPGGWMRIFGKSLGRNGTSRVRLTAQNFHVVELEAHGTDDYALKITVPVSLPAGSYAISVHNGYGGADSWHSAGTLTVQEPDRWKTDVYPVEARGGNPSEALSAALDKARKNGGGIVHLPRGRYPVPASLEIPPRTLLRGEAMELVSLCWPDYDAPPQSLIHGSDFGLESLTIYCQNHRDVVVASRESQCFSMNKVRIRANCFFMIANLGKEFHHRHGPKSNEECGAAVLLEGNNFSVTDCDIYASNTAIRIRNGKVGVIARNRFQYAIMAHGVENSDRLIFEDNEISGNDLLAEGNNFTTFYSNYCRHIYYARNHTHSVYGGDRELMTLDAAGSAYMGTVARMDGVHLTLAADPIYKDYAHPSHTDWTGAAVQILEGRGAGQYRFITANSGREWQIDQPWDVAPDATSQISIAPFRGQSLFIGNRLEDGGAFQLYAMAHDSIVADNVGARIDGFLVWGLNPHGWGVQPSFFCQFLDNEITEGNGYGERSARFGTVAFDESGTYKGALVRAPIFRRNLCRNNAGLVIKGATVDALVEKCAIHDTDTAIVVSPNTRAVLLRANTFERVEQGIIYSSSDAGKQSE